MKKILTVSVISLLLFQPSNDTISQKAKTKADTTNTSLKENVDIKADSVLNALGELKQVVEDNQVVKWKVKWRTKIVTIHDTVCQCPPVDSIFYIQDPDPIIIHDTVVVVFHDTVKVKKKDFLAKTKKIILNKNEKSPSYSNYYSIGHYNLDYI